MLQEYEEGRWFDWSENGHDGMLWTEHPEGYNCGNPNTGECLYYEFGSTEARSNTILAGQRPTPYQRKMESGMSAVAYDFDGEANYVALLDWHWGSTVDGVMQDAAVTGAGQITKLTVIAWVNTSFYQDTSSTDNDNWGIIDFDRSEYFNLYITGEGFAKCVA